MQLINYAPINIEPQGGGGGGERAAGRAKLGVLTAITCPHLRHHFSGLSNKFSKMFSESFDHPEVSCSREFEQKISGSPQILDLPALRLNIDSTVSVIGLTHCIPR